MKNRIKRVSPILVAALVLVVLGACNNQEGAAGNTAGVRTATPHPHPTPPVGNRNINDVTIIPSAAGEKTYTTNEHGGTFSGMGTSVYSLIGSSSLHAGGFSSKLESMLDGAGVDGVKVLVLDDTVVLADTGKRMNTMNYDPLQSKVLNATSGPFATGPKNSSGFTGTMGTMGKADDSDLAKAKREIQSMFGKDVRILTVSDSRAVQAIDRVKANMKSDSGNQQQVLNDLSLIIKTAKSAP